MIPKTVAAGLTLALLWTSAASAQVTIDVAKITCQQYILFKVADPQKIAIWLSGYYHGMRGTTVVDPQMVQDSDRKVRDYCATNPNMPVMQAVETLLAPGK